MEVVQKTANLLKRSMRNRSNTLLPALQAATFKITDREDRPTFQQAVHCLLPPHYPASREHARLSLRKKTMMMAQRLLRKPVTSPICVPIPPTPEPDAITMARDYITENFGDKYRLLAESGYSNKENSQKRTKLSVRLISL